MLVTFVAAGALAVSGCSRAEETKSASKGISHHATYGQDGRFTMQLRISRNYDDACDPYLESRFIVVVLASTKSLDDQQFNFVLKDEDGTAYLSEPAFGEPNSVQFTLNGMRSDSSYTITGPSEGRMTPTVSVTCLEDHES